MLAAAVAPPKPVEPGRFYQVLLRTLTAVGAVDQAPGVVIRACLLGRDVAIAPRQPGPPLPLIALIRQAKDEPPILARCKHDRSRCVRAGRSRSLSPARCTL